ncbi:hypothetical protein WAI453_004868 [Rhynchosporium graminicola]
MAHASSRDILVQHYDSDTATLDVSGSEYEDLEMGLPSRSRGFFFMVTLAMGFGGLQLVFAVQWSYGSVRPRIPGWGIAERWQAYLTSLGLSKMMLGVAWIGGPLSGVFIQPLIGAASDRCRSPWGRRKPFIAAGGAIVTLSLLCLAWCRELLQGSIGIFLQHPSADFVDNITVPVAIFLFYLLNFGIQPLQSGLRALVVDSCPIHLQEKSTAYAGLSTSIGSIVGYIAGFIDLPQYLPLFGNSQFKILCALTCIGLVSTLLLCCCFVEERQFRPKDEKEDRKKFSTISKMLYSFRTLSKRTKQIYKVHFFTSMGWSPFLFYISIYVAEICNQLRIQNIKLRVSNIGFTDERSKSDHKHYLDPLSDYADASRYPSFVLLLYAATSFISGLILYRLVQHYGLQSGFGDESKFFRLRLSLKGIWLVSNVFCAACMLSTPFLITTRGVTIVVCLLGIPWSITIWVPFALIGIETSRLRQTAALGLDTCSAHDRTGTILAVHSAAIALPQIIATMGASLIFWVMGDQGVTWVIACGGLAALVAAWMTLGVSESRGELREEAYHLGVL